MDGSGAINVSFERGQMRVKLWGVITARVLDHCLSAIGTQREIAAGTSVTEEIVLDLSNVALIKDSGAISIVCLCSAFMSGKLQDLVNPTSIYLKLPSQNVLNYLMRIGFFSQMEKNAGLLGHGEQIKLEERMKEIDDEKAEKSTWDDSVYREGAPIIWPMKIIGHKERQYVPRDFETACQRLVRDASKRFQRLLSFPQFSFSKEDTHNFLGANYELYMNVYEHSGSWGLAMIHAQPRVGTFLCCYDIGVGIRQSVNASENVPAPFDRDEDAIRWAVMEGHSSKIGGNGAGLAIIEDFAFDKAGILEIRSGTCLMQKTPKNNTWKSYIVPWFPGTQINIIIPA